MPPINWIHLTNEINTWKKKFSLSFCFMLYHGSLYSFLICSDATLKLCYFYSGLIFPFCLSSSSILLCSPIHTAPGVRNRCFLDSILQFQSFLQGAKSQWSFREATVIFPILLILTFICLEPKQAKKSMLACPWYKYFTL